MNLPIGNSGLVGRRSAFFVPFGDSPTGIAESPVLPSQIGTLRGFCLNNSTFGDCLVVAAKAHLKGFIG
jgi:hypothetical protein